MKGIDLRVIIPPLIRRTSCAWTAAVAAGGGRCSVCACSFMCFNSIDRWPVLTRCPAICSRQAALNPTRNRISSAHSASVPPSHAVIFYCSRASFRWESNWILANSVTFVCPLLKKRKKKGKCCTARSLAFNALLTVLASLTRGFSRSESCTGLKTLCYIIRRAAVDVFKLECRFKGAFWCFYG